MKEKDTEAWKELVKNPAAVAYYNVWHAHLSEMGKIGARVVFLFDHLEIP